MVATEMGNPLSWCVPLPFRQTNCFNLSFFDSPSCFEVSDHPKLEDCYQGQVQTALEFALTIEDFDDLVDPHHLYDCCLGLEPLAFVLKKIALEVKSMYNLTFLFPFSLQELGFLTFCFVEMATRYSKDKYIRVKNLKNEPLSQLTPRSKKRKLDEGKDETPTPLSLFGTDNLS